MRSSRLKRGAVLIAASLFALGAAGCGSKGASGYAAEAAAKSAKDASDWLAKNAKEPGVKTLPDGLQYRVVSTGAGGASPKLGDEVRVNYEGALTDGTVFDSSYARGQPAVFTVGEVVPAWNEALQLMKPGDTWYLYVPPKLGYGPAGQGPIPPNAIMVFKIELIAVLPGGGAGGANA